MSKEGNVRVRVEADLKEEAEAILAALGLSPSSAVRLFYTQIVRQKGIPFPVKIETKEEGQP